MQPKPFVSIQNVAKRWNGQLGVEGITLDIEEGSVWMWKIYIAKVSRWT